MSALTVTDRLARLRDAVDANSVVGADMARICQDAIDALNAKGALIRILLEQEPRPSGARAYEVTVSHTLWARLQEAGK